jgi:hypothetical protein
MSYSPFLSTLALAQPVHTIILDFWLTSKSTTMNINYNYTGYYAIQVNTINSANTITEEMSNIPNSNMNNLFGAKLTAND